MGNYGTAGFWIRGGYSESGHGHANYTTYDSGHRSMALSPDALCCDTAVRPVRKRGSQQHPASAVTTTSSSASSAAAAAAAAASAAASSSAGTAAPYGQLLFHPRAKGRNVTLDGGRTRATRRHSFCHGVAFGHRPLRPCERVRLRFTATAPGWSGALRFGFTSRDPGTLDSARIPRYACPDLAARPGYWAKALPESCAGRGSALEFWAEADGRAFYRVDAGEAVPFLRGVDAAGPLWALIDVYGVTQQVTLLETGLVKPPRRLASFQLCPRLPYGARHPPTSSSDINQSQRGRGGGAGAGGDGREGEDDEEEEGEEGEEAEGDAAEARPGEALERAVAALRDVRIGGEPASSRAARAPSLGAVEGSRRQQQQQQQGPDASSIALPDDLNPDLWFHAMHGSGVLLSDDRSLARSAPDVAGSEAGDNESNGSGRFSAGQSLVFTNRPVFIGETIYVRVGGQQQPGDPITFGLTSCDPATLRPDELPTDPHSLVDRREYWVVVTVCPLPGSAQQISEQDEGGCMLGEAVLGLVLMPDGEVHLSLNGTREGMLVCADPGPPLWLLFGFRNATATAEIGILGTQKASFLGSSSPSMGSNLPSSDSDITISNSISFSSSSSSLVTAPGSPLGDGPAAVFPACPAPTTTMAAVAVVAGAPPRGHGERASSPRGRGECTICFENPADSVIYTCGHLCLCYACGQRLRRQINPACPICRRLIKDVIRTYPI
ncbi:LOW QUALITY PROTEIN: E3 ubiquitin-protein ligase NEURL1B-like [Lethenteron reissneri]|uniref:LOW QUALITY PROTEIN: E3 ubiquitin-protein ligase NEURL1B-like n=1 Tax=Lethenteron reissneri TaxID=7753 RepID=UPI002AB6EBAF|nr:LOW QUALITY PROTEIN: E3 ubiquitin-protein ligase NEURL1B-like [Lethenteron reissneri]